MYQIDLNPPIFLQRQFGIQPPNLIPANISGYAVHDIVLMNYYQPTGWNLL